MLGFGVCTNTSPIVWRRKGQSVKGGSCDYLSMDNLKHTPVTGDLPDAWRNRAVFLQEYGEPNTARLWRLAATELETAIRELGEETLTLVEAAAVCGYSADYLGGLVRRGTIPNFGRKNAPRIQRSNLPTKSSGKPGRTPHSSSADKITSIATKRH